MCLQKYELRITWSELLHESCVASSITDGATLRVYHFTSDASLSICNLQRPRPNACIGRQIRPFMQPGSGSGRKLTVCRAVGDDQRCGSPLTDAVKPAIRNVGSCGHPAAACREHGGVRQIVAKVFDRKTTTWHEFDLRKRPSEGIDQGKATNNFSWKEFYVVQTVQYCQPLRAQKRAALELVLNTSRWHF